MTNTQISAAPQSIEDAVRHHQAGRLADAEAIYREMLKLEPARADALHLLGVIALQCGEPETAIDLITQSLARNPRNTAALNHLGETYRSLGGFDAAADCYRQAIEIHPNYAEAHNNLGIVLQSQDRLDEAAGHFRRAIDAKSDWGGAYFNLGLTLKRAGDIAGAASAFTMGWARDPSCLDAAGQCVATVAALARGSAVAVSSVQPEPSPEHFISVVFCSIDDDKCARTAALYRRLLTDVPHEIIAIRDARSLAEAYNRAIAKCRGDLVILSHDDIDILASDFSPRLRRHLRQFDVVGVVGGTRLNGPQWKSCGHPHLRGWITHPAPNNEGYLVGVLDPRPVGRDLAALDGVFLAVHRDVFSDVVFDEETFDGFHLYDIDWSCRASKAGFRLGVAGDLLVLHASRGQYRDEWRRYAERFCRKHQVELSAVGPTMIFEAELETLEHVRQFYTRLELLASTSTD
jgi:tetratricopeptide (TPR) repeat protein